MTNTKEKAPINWHFTCQLTSIYENLQKKVNVLVRLHEAMQETLKTASYSEPILIITLAPDKWSRMYCSEYFNNLNTLFELHMKSKNQVKYQQSLLLKKEKAIITETLHLVTNVSVCHHFYITIIHKSIFLTATSLVHLMWKCS